MDWQEERRLVKVARMYYEENMTQNEIAKELGVYRTTVTRLLQKAKDQKIVTIHIESTLLEYVSIEKELCKLFGLKDVVIVPSSADSLKEIGKAALRYLDGIITKDDVVGCAWGRTLGMMAQQAQFQYKRGGRFVPLVGGPGQMPVEEHVNAIVYSMARAFGGETNFIDAAAIVKSVETQSEILKSGYMTHIRELWESLSIALIGIGSPMKSSNLVWSGFLGEEEVEKLENQEVVGDVCSRFYDIKGQELATDLKERAIAIPFSKLKEVKHSIALVESVSKTDSIIGALNGRIANVLITDEITAKSIIKKKKEEII
ncbi:hypothetical protein CHH69_13700 [Terribacillus saccharophilus]|uniref:sugar-binding transcriptional regulator n=1 Tax=Terribacillus saccharophilus TaxID=361277 RepID=UPI000BA539FB|nr:sugar-binding transcriptional regulator [Terribacillus saccharophilus]PAF34839.1 hypothetical protein CHH69_13700 [Terribacillus saccharophilus]